MFGEGGVRDACRPRVPSADEGGTALLVPLNTNPNTFSPEVEDSRIDTVRIFYSLQ